MKDFLMVMIKMIQWRKFHNIGRENILLQMYSLQNWSTSEHKTVNWHEVMLYAAQMHFCWVLFYIRKKSKFLFPFWHLKWPWTWLFPSLKFFTGTIFEGCKYSSFSGMRRSLMGNHIQQSCSILSQQTFFKMMFSLYLV